MGRNREVIEARTAYWMSIAEQYAKSKFNGDHPEHISIALNLFNESTYPYYQIVAALGEREAIYEQIDQDIEDLCKCMDIIKRIASMLRQNSWTVNDLEDAISFLFSGNAFVRNVFDAEISGGIDGDDMFKDRIDFIQNISQHIQDLPEESEE